MTWNKDLPLRRAEGILFQELDGEAVLLNLDKGEYYGLNIVGARAWALLAEPYGLGSLVEALLDEFDVQREVLQADLDVFLHDLLQEGLVYVVAA